ncbi:hypothetical protein ElyMa_005503900 [Elysia marginata]|uniref:Uncharacterized protein n=1 Tax=Elysia marginata TaxID=1093978 RepID=A0AAV4EV44_9GAST|nr:hypothetical protein ElyMa_005503900 [Elysia marginata]
MAEAAVMSSCAEDERTVKKEADMSAEEEQLALDLAVEDEVASVIKTDQGQNLIVDSAFQQRQSPRDEQTKQEWEEGEEKQNDSVVKTPKAEEGVEENSPSEPSVHHDTGEEALGCACKKQCWKKFTPEERQQIYTRFWELGSDMMRRCWLRKHVTRRCNLYGASQPTQRGLYKKYQLFSSKIERRVKVCSSFFKTTIGLSMPELLHFLDGSSLEEQSFESNSGTLCDINSNKGSSRIDRVYSCTVTDQEKLHAPSFDKKVNSTGLAEEADSVLNDASSVDEDWSSLQIHFDLGDEVAALCVKQAFLQQPKLFSEVPKEQSTALILNKFNQTYPMHSMDMSHFLPIYHKVFKKFKRRKISRCCQDEETSLSDEVRENEMNNESDALGEDDFGKKGKPEFHSENNIKARLRRRPKMSGTSQANPSKSETQRRNDQKDFVPKRSVGLVNTNDLSGAKQKIQRAIRSRVKRLKEYAIAMQAAMKKKRDENYEKSDRVVAKSTVVNTHNRTRRDTLKVLRFKHKHPMLPACNCTRRNCSAKIPEEQRQAIHEAFWKIISVYDKKAWLLKYVDRLKPADNIVSFFHRKKYLTKKYFLPDSQGEKVEVCRLCFNNTLGFKWDSVIDHIVRSKLPVSRITQTPRKRTPRWLPEKIIGSVQKYILSVTENNKIFGVREESSSTSLYTEKRSTSKSPRDSAPAMKLKDLYREYKEKHQSLKFNLGYQSFRRICENALCQRQRADSKSTNGCEIPEQHKELECELSDEDNNDSIHTPFQNSAFELEGSGSNSTNTPPVKGQKKFVDVSTTCDIINEATSSSQSLPARVNKRTSENCILDVGSGILKKSTAFSIRIPHDTAAVKRKNRPLSKMNDKSNYPVLPPCKCVKKCFEKFTEQQRQELNDKYWTLPSYNVRKQWLNEHIERYDVQRRSVQPSSHKPASRRPFRKTESRSYFLPDRFGSKIGVCRYFFLGTLGYKWDSVIGTLTRTTGRDNKQVTPDMRGRGPPHHKISEDAVVSVVKYSESVCLTHRDLYKMKSLESLARFGKSDMIGTLRNYGLTALQLFKDYKTKHPNQKLSYASFRRVFKRVHSAIVLSDYPHFGDPSYLNKEISLDMDEDSPNTDQHGASTSTCEEEDNEIFDDDDDGEPEYLDNSDLEGLPVVPTPVLDQQNVKRHDPCSDDELGLSDGDGVGCADSSRLNMPESVLTHVHSDLQRGSKSYSYPEEGKNFRPIPGHMPFPQSFEYIPHAHSSLSESYVPRSAAEESLTCEQTFLPVSNFTGGGASSYPAQFSSQQNSQFLSRLTKEPSHYQKSEIPHTQHVNLENCDLIYDRATSQYHSMVSRLAENQHSDDQGSFPPHHAALDPRVDCGYRTQNAFPTMNELGQNYYLNPSHYAGNQPQTHFMSLPNTQPPNSSLVVPNQSGIPFGSFTNFAESCAPADTTYTNSFLKPDKVEQTKQSSEGEAQSIPLKMKRQKGRPGKISNKGLEGAGEKSSGRSKSVRNFGSSYPMLSPCSCKKLQCGQKFSEEARQKIHDSFWALGSYNNRKQWLLHHIKRIDIKRRRVDCPQSFRKNETRYYFLPQSENVGDVLEVCKTFFLRTLGYKWDKVIDTLRKTTPRGGAVSQPDGRGRRSPAHKISVVITQSVLSYVRSVWQAAEMNHSTASTSLTTGGSKGSKVKPSNGQHIPFGLSMQNMYNNYIAKHKDHKISYRSFCRICKSTDFNVMSTC